MAQSNILTIPQNLNEQVWPLLNPDLTTPLEHKPTQPITTLQKRWMKALLNDPRIRLFAPPVDGLEDVEPLCPADTFIYFDRYGDGDPYEDPQYIQRFQTILTALREKRWLRLHFSHLEKETERIDDSLTLHYEKDDETELLIRVLSFGHMLKVISPDQFREKLKNRIEKQMQLRTQK